MIEQYAVIQTYRYGEVFRILWEVDGEMEGEMVPKYIIQPLVENALFHGLLPNKEANGDVVGGVITVRVARDGAKTVIAVSDNGRGIEPERLGQLNRAVRWESEGESGSIGLLNVAMRLRLLYGDGARMELRCEDGRTTVELRYENRAAPQG